MKRTTYALFGLMLAVGLLCGTANAQEDAFARLKTYDSQKRQAIEELRLDVQASLADPAKRVRVEDGLIAVLSDPNATYAGKQEACYLLRMAGAERSVTLLAKLLGDPKTADIARYGLENSPDPTVGKALVAALKTAKGKTAVGIVNTLGNRGDAGAVAALKLQTASPDPAIADAAVVALGKIGTPEAVGALETVTNRPLLVGQALLRAGDRLAASGKTPLATKIYAARVADMREPAVRAAALRRLAVVAPAQALPLALNALRTKDERVALVAGNVVGALADGPTVQRSSKSWETLPAVAQIPVLAGLTQRKVGAALPFAEKVAKSEDELARVTAIRALAIIGGAKYVPTLAGMAATAQGETKQAARLVLIEMPGTAAQTAILQTAKSGEMPSRVALIGILAERGTGEDLALLKESLIGSEEPIAVEALKATERNGIKADPSVLVRVLTTTTSDSVRDAAQATLVSNAKRAPETEDAVIAALAAATPPVKATLLGALAQLGGDKGLAELSKAIGSTDAEVKSAAITGLAETWSDSRPLPLLLATAKADTGKSYRVQALRGYFRLLGQEEKMPPTERVGKVREGLLAAERPEEKQQALGVLRETRIPAAVELANLALDDPALFDVAADTILFLAGEQKKGDATLPAVKSPATTAALNKIVLKSKDDAMKAQAKKLL